MPAAPTPAPRAPVSVFFDAAKIAAAALAPKPLPMAPTVRVDDPSDPRAAALAKVEASAVAKRSPKVETPWTVAVAASRPVLADRHVRRADRVGPVCDERDFARASLWARAKQDRAYFSAG